MGRGFRWLLWIWLGLLLASHLTRRVAPVAHPSDPDEAVQAVREVAGERETTRPVRIAYRAFGPAPGDSVPTIVLVHGSPGDNGEVTALARVLGERARTIAPDLPGFGGSSWDVPDYSNRAHARYLLQLLDSLHLRRVHLLGFSMGGGVVLQMADLAPERVRSITMLSAIGAQEYELLGDYHLNHLIHGLQLAGLWLLREATPHFGWLDDGMLSVPYARNFYDTDQRPLRGVLERYAGPMLILQGERDVLVNPALAREHARIVPQAELAMDQGDHFTAFTRPAEVAARVEPFIEKVERGEATTRATAAADRVEAAARPWDPRDLPRVKDFALLIVLLLLAAATLVSEDLTCITAGLMIARGSIGFVPGVAACFVGIFVGDLLVFLAGRTVGRALLGRVPLRWFLSADRVAVASQWVERQGAGLVFVTRFIPGTRLPSYFAAGMLRTSVTRFTLYFFLACLIWTPILVGIAAAFGEVTQSILGVFRQQLTLYLVVTGLVLFLLLKLILPLLSWRGRRLLLGRWRRLTRWEFWPRWAFYPPVVLYVLRLALRHRSLTLFTAANPAIPGGGFVGESKAEILRGLAPSGVVTPWELLEASGTVDEKLERLDRALARWQTGYPVVLKPDIGERGTGVVIIGDVEQARAYFTAARGDILLQRFAPGREFGVFYTRRPGEAAGSIFAITDKRFLTLTGDGRRTLEELILADDRAVCMAPHHFRRHASRLAEILPAGEVFTLVEVGTHARGALFLDGAWVKTPALEAAIDRVSRSYEGFWFGRYDIRTEDLEAFQRGEGFQVLELNGATAEATNIYDPKNSLFTAYRTLFAQWRLLFEIAAENVARGAQPATPAEVFGLLRRHRAALHQRR